MEEEDLVTDSGNCEGVGHQQLRQTPMAVDHHTDQRYFSEQRTKSAVGRPGQDKTGQDRREKINTFETGIFTRRQFHIRCTVST